MAQVAEGWQAAAERGPAELAEPVESARAAGLRYVSDLARGIRRRKSGAGFSYLGPDGESVRDETTIRRIKRLAVPPAWTDVWICPDPRGHLQATGRDVRGRKQYRYHVRWREVRDAVKYDRMPAFARALPRIRKRTDRDLKLPDMPQDKVLAVIVCLLEETLIRVGNDEYRKANGSFGLTTLRNRHVDVIGSEVHFNFKGKSGKQRRVSLQDRRIARVIKRLADLPGQELFEYVDASGEPRPLESDDVNQYLRRISGQDFTAKDFRTWAGTILAARFLRQARSKAGSRAAKKELIRAVARVAEELGNTPTICKKCYIHPAVITAYLTGALKPIDEKEEENPGELSAEERGLLKILSSQASNGNKTKS